MSRCPRTHNGSDPSGPMGPQGPGSSKGQQGSKVPKDQQGSRVSKCDLCIEFTCQGSDGVVRIPFSHVRKGRVKGNGAIVFTLDGMTVTLSESVVREILEQL